MNCSENAIWKYNFALISATISRLFQVVWFAKGVLVILELNMSSLKMERKKVESGKFSPRPNN